LREQGADPSDLAALFILRKWVWSNQFQLHIGLDGLEAGNCQALDDLAHDVTSALSRHLATLP
jgi:hypothetical protein